MSYAAERSLLDRAKILGWKGDAPSVAGTFAWNEAVTAAREWLENGPDPVPGPSEMVGDYMFGKSYRTERERERGE